MNQWLMLISLLVVLNMTVMMGMVVLMAYDVAPETMNLQQMVMAGAPSTKTPLPTFTPPPPRAVAATSTPLPTATSTLVATLTPSITPTPTETPTPTITPIPPTSTPTSPPIQARAWVVASATPQPTPTPDVDFLASVRQLTACENAGKHHIFVYVLDQQGQGMPNMQVRVTWVGGEAILTTGDKGSNPGLVDFAMFKGTYRVELVNASSQVIDGITPDIPRDEMCDETGNPVGNSLFHYSYEVTFTKVR